MGRKKYLFSMPELFDSAIEQSRECLERLCDAAERDGTEADATLYSVDLGRKVLWYRPKKATLKEKKKIAKAVRACMSWQAADAARKEYNRFVREVGKANAERLFQAATNFGKCEILFRVSNNYNIGFGERWKLKKRASITNKVRRAKQPNYQKAFDEQMKKGMGIGSACEEIAHLYDVHPRTVRRSIQVDKR